MAFTPILADFDLRNDYKSIDLSISKLKSLKIDPQDQKSLSEYLFQVKQYKNAKVLFGGYLEKRSLYNQKELFNNKSKQRNIHLGVDFWADAGEAILCPMDGVIHSFADNKGFGNYGPCIILKHHRDNLLLYSLYGHLSRESLLGLEIGQSIKKNQVLSHLGSPTENGGYVPHLHFQLIKDVGDYNGDYPGVCHQDDLDFFKSNTISPLEFLGL